MTLIRELLEGFINSKNGEKLEAALQDLLLDKSKKVTYLDDPDLEDRIEGYNMLKKLHDDFDVPKPRKNRREQTINMWSLKTSLDGKDVFIIYPIVLNLYIIDAVTNREAKKIRELVAAEDPKMFKNLKNLADNFNKTLKTTEVIVRRVNHKSIYCEPTRSIFSVSLKKKD